VVETGVVEEEVRRERPHNFKFEAGWLQEEQCGPIVENAWKLCVNARGGNVKEAVGEVAKELWDWSHNVLGDLEKRIKRAKRDLEMCRRSPLNDRSVNRELLLKHKLEKLEDQRDLYWRQRAHVDWLKKGDRNTNFFHQQASERKRRSRIKKLIRDDGQVVTENNDISQMIVEFYRDLFQSRLGTRYEEILNHVTPRVTTEMNASLNGEFTGDEIRAALEGIGDLKAPGSDGMPSIFYKKYWDTVGPDIIREVKQFLQGGRMPTGWNDTVVVLIPKVPQPEKLKDLRPISLCNVVYKIASKVLSNRLKGILPDVISLNQSAFVPGRLITDNVLLAYEFTHFMQTKRTGIDNYAAVKLDMSKAYDRVEWEFLRRMMLKMGFNEQWVDTIMMCVSTVAYQIKINGELSDVIVPGRGLRQGDPLSPYLFLICAEGFSTLLNAAEQNGDLSGVKVCNGAPSVNHLLFADDSLLLLKADERSANHLRNILQLYEECSGQMINKEKSSIMFSKNTGEVARERFKSALGIPVEAMNEKYLGLPVYMGRSRAKTFAYLKDRIWKKLQGWMEKLLSKPGKEVLIKAVAQAIPTYAMSCFDLTKTLCDDISSMIGRYWWANQDNEKKMHWLSWDTLCKRKDAGGLGFRDLHNFNLAMLARQGWRLLMAPDSLCAQVLRAKYFPHGDLLNVQERPGISYAWRSIIRGMQALKQGLIWRIGNGEQINIWGDPWIPNAATRRPSTPRGRNILTRVSHLIDPVTGGWDEQLVKDIFWEQDATLILSIPVRIDQEDFLAWHPDGKGVFSVKSAYHVLKDKQDLEARRQVGEASNGSCSRSLDWSVIWKQTGQPKVLQFLWRLAHNSLALGTNIKRRGMQIETLCPVCHRLDEDGGHLFLKCKSVKACWRQLNLEATRIMLVQKRTGAEVVQAILQLDESTKTLIIHFLWVWWNARNKANNGERMASAGEVCHRAVSMAAEAKMHLGKGSDGSKQQVQRQETWCPPPDDTLKINFDGAFMKETKRGSWGFVVRDVEGTGVLAGCGMLSHVSDALIAEAEACVAAVRAAAEWGVSRVIIESDSLNLVKALKTTSFDQAPGGVLFMEAREIINMHFIVVDIRHCRRSANYCAHMLAHNALSGGMVQPCIWSEPLPSHVIDLLVRDIAEPNLS
jgi:ribonuclease HI